MKKSAWTWLYALIFVLWSVYRLASRYPEWVDEFIAKPILQVAPVLLVVRYLEKKRFDSVGVSRDRFALRAGAGIIIGGILFWESFVLQRMFHDIRVVRMDELILPFFISVATGISEELVFRGYFTSRVRETIENVYMANAVQTLLFIAIHVPLMIFTFHYTGSEMLAYSLQLGFLGFIYGIIYISSMNQSSRQQSRMRSGIFPIFFSGCREEVRY